MKIVSVETKHVTENPFAGLCETEGEFKSYYVCKIVADNGVFHGKGETEEVARQDVVENMQAAKKNEIAKAVSEYNAEQGVYFVDC